MQEQENKQENVKEVKQHENKKFDKKRDKVKRTDRKAKSEFIENVVEVKSVVKVTKGGRQRRFQAVVVVGNKKGLVGLGIGKAAEVPEAVSKALNKANKNLIKVPIVEDRTIPHETIGIKGATRVVLKPASRGTGIIAGGAVRAVLELAGVKDIVSKSLGSRTKINMVNATMNGLKSLKTIEKVCELRGKTKEEILGWNYMN